MPSKRNLSRDLTFTLADVRGATIRTSDVEEAIGLAANVSSALGGKYTTVSVWAHTERGASLWGGNKGVEHFRILKVGEPLATIQIKVHQPAYWR